MSVGVLVGVAVGVTVGVFVIVGVLVGVSVGVKVGVIVGVLVGVLVGVDVGVLVGVFVGVGVKSQHGKPVSSTVAEPLSVAVRLFPDQSRPSISHFQPPQRFVVSEPHCPAPSL